MKTRGAVVRLPAVFCGLAVAVLAGCGAKSGQGGAAGPADVSTGYGSQPRELTTSAVSSYEPTEAEAAVSTIEQLLRRVSGLEVIPEGSGYRLRIRGARSFNNNTDPLIVVDGRVAGYGLVSVPPQDIAKIDVLKDAAATALYGMRGANGVVVITTKRSAGR